MSHFTFVLVILLLKLGSSVGLKCYLAFLRKATMCPVTKYVYEISFIQSGITPPLAVRSTLTNQQHIFKKVLLNRNTYETN